MSIYNNDNGFQAAQRDYDNQLPDDNKNNIKCGRCNQPDSCEYCDYEIEETEDE